MFATKSLSHIFSVLLIAASLLASQPARPVYADGSRFVSTSRSDLSNTWAQPGPAFVVNTIFDTDDSSCDTLGQGIGNKDCSLRDAINAANTLGGTDTITFSLSGAIALGSTLPDVNSRAALTIDGTGQALTISGRNSVRIMIVDGGGILSLNNLTIANGSSSAGGAIYNTGTLIITNSTFSGNNAAGTGIGGGIYNSDTLTIANSTFSGNNSGDYGGSIYNAGTLAVTNSTFSANSALVGGGIFNSGSATLRNTIVANSSSGGNCGGTITNAGNNLDSGTTCGWASAAGSISNTDPLLGPLANYGGPTQTFALLPGSPAIDTGNNSVCATTSVNGLDQRGLARSYGATCDIGSFEWRLYTISGSVGMAGATLSYNDGSDKTATSQVDGTYSFNVPDHWSGTVTPSKPGYTFSPPNRDYSSAPVTADQSAQDFSATLNTYVISGQAADGGVILTYPGGTTTSEGSGRYSISVPYGWNGTITPSKSGLVFTPASYSYTNISANQTHQDYSATASFISTGAQDGWILESGENTNKGGTLNTKATTFILGDNAARRQYRGILSFGTGAALPDGAMITRVTLLLKKGPTTGSGNPLNIFKGLMLDIKDGFFGSTSALQAGDFQAAASKSYGPFKPIPSSSWYTIDLTAASGTINTLATGSGLTQIRLRFKWDDNNNAVANTLSLYSGNAPAPNRPQLIITYHMP